MSKSESNGKIRQVAIVLSSVDAATARHLLGQLPASQARLVRQQIATLTNVSPSEREAAAKMLAQLSRVSKANSKSSSSIAPPSANSSSPAEALLSNVPRTLDRIELTDAYESFPKSTSHSRSFEGSPSANIDSLADERFVPVQSESEQPFQNPSWVPAWQLWSGEELARLLSNERPLLIAAVLFQAPAELGSRILQALPVQVAASVLAALPQLHTTDPSVLQEIHLQLHRRLIDFQRQSSPANGGMTKLHAILGEVSDETRQRLEQQLVANEPLLAHALGLQADSRSVMESPTVSNQSDSTQSTSAMPVVVKFNNLPRPRVVKSEATPNVNEAVNNSIKIAPILHDQRASISDFESLQTLSREDFAIVLRSVDPQTVLLAASSASPTMLIRIESLLNPMDVKRLRAKLQIMRSYRAHERQAAQEKIAQAAHGLIQQGRIAGLANLTILAAA